MGMFVSDFIPYDVTVRAVNLDTEYMYRCDGLKLKVIRFEYYKSDNSDFNWFILSQIDGSNAIKADRYKVSDLYLDCPINKEVQHSVNYAYDNLGIEKGKYVGTTDKQVLIQILARFRWDLYDIAEKLENPNVE